MTNKQLVSECLDQLDKHKSRIGWWNARRRTVYLEIPNRDTRRLVTTQQVPMRRYVRRIDGPYYMTNEGEVCFCLKTAHSHVMEVVDLSSAPDYTLERLIPFLY